ncbi:MAG: hypothetical protein WKG07_40725 [Hymenobacter sp.]
MAREFVEPGQKATIFFDKSTPFSSKNFRASAFLSSETFKSKRGSLSKTVVVPKKLFQFPQLDLNNKKLRVFRFSIRESLRASVSKKPLPSFA